MNSNDERRGRASHRGSASVRRSGSHSDMASKSLSKETERKTNTVNRTERQMNSASKARQQPERRDRTPVNISNPSKTDSYYRSSYRSSEFSGQKTHVSSDRKYREENNNQYSGRRSEGRSSKSGGGKNNNNLIFAGIAFVIALVLCIFIAFKFVNKGETEKETKPADPNEIIQDAVIDLSLLVEPKPEATEEANSEKDEDKTVDSDPSKLYIKGMTLDEIREAISKNYDWSLKIVNEDAEVGEVVKPTVDANETTEAATMGDAEKPDQLLEPAAASERTSESLTVSNEIHIPDLVSLGIDELIKSISDNENALRKELAASEAETETEKKKRKKESETEEEVKLTEYKLELPAYDTFIEEAVSNAETMWYKAPKGGGIGSYDKETDSFIMEGAEDGFEVDTEALKSELSAAIDGGNYTESVQVPGEVIKTDMKAVKAEYKTLASFSTKTTNNSVRNNNIKIACEKLNGTIVKPGEEFSFNDVVGERTAEKGYGAAAAYNNGEVVQEIGGGVCQVSTTLYNAVLRAGLKTTKRQSHTFKPSYVTPGWDATISWGGPDYRFANVPSRAEYSNDKTYAIGIRAHYANNEVTVSIYGRPVLKEGYSYDLESKKIKDIDIVRKPIEEGSDKQPTEGSMGSQWSTDVIIKKDGKEIKREYDHKTYYSGHIQYYLEEVPTESTVESSSETGPSEPTEAVDVTGPDGGPGVNMTGSPNPEEPDNTRPSDQLDNNGPGTDEVSGQDRPGDMVETFPKETSAGFIDIF
ncbi:MAG: VanW family protein [Eubacteriales bacterium]|nr:VanW family protein [Eubacteriales bacterium]